ncbi:c-type cytochrome [Pelagibius sp. Alg239-R121]|uniref:c-type cytochrome n=1 Tax=Pelagibius sp. Alg239-R121 TaxID=2993448 RepID=UPI0024A70DCF|nr:c-type cytochrome [Pelagibius sp. Alg239-R121]
MFYVTRLWRLGAISMLPLAFAMAEASAQDLELGEYLAQECTSCHQPQQEDSGIPSFHRLDQAEFIEAMADYRDGFRENHAMEMVARSFSDEDIAALAAWFAAQKSK